MYKSGATLRTSADFDNAMLFELDIEVWQKGDILDYGGKITENKEHSVKINDGLFLKPLCEFRVR